MKDSKIVQLGYFTYTAGSRTRAAVGRPLQQLVDVAVYRRGWSCCLWWRQWEDEKNLLGGGRAEEAPATAATATAAAQAAGGAPPSLTSSFRSVGVQLVGHNPHLGPPRSEQMLRF